MMQTLSRGIGQLSMVLVTLLMFLLAFSLFGEDSCGKGHYLPKVSMKLNTYGEMLICHFLDDQEWQS